MRTMSRRDTYLAKRINVSAATPVKGRDPSTGGKTSLFAKLVSAQRKFGVGSPEAQPAAKAYYDDLIAFQDANPDAFDPRFRTTKSSANYKRDVGMSNVSAATLVKFICADRNTANRLARQALAAKVPGLRVDGDTGVMVPQKSVNALKKVADQEGITVTQQGGNVSASALDFELITKMITGNQRASEIADYYSDRVGFSERQWDMLVDGRYSKLFDLRDPMSKLKLVQAMSKMRNVTLPPELSGKKPPTVSASVTQPRMRAYDFSFSNDLDRELFITEVEAMRFPAGTKPPHLETWNASATVWANDPRVVAAAQRIARGYYGVKMSNALPVSAAGTMLKDPAEAAAAEQKAMAFLNAAKAAGDRQDWTSQASNYAAHQQQLIMRQMYLGKISKEDAMKSIQAIKMSNALPVSAAGKITKFMGKNAPKLVRYTIKKTGEGDELVVRFFTADGQHYEPADYFTDDKGDAKSTGDDVIKRNAAMSNVSAADDGGFLSNGFSFITPEKGKQFAKIVKSKFPMMQVRLMSNDQVVDVSHIDPEDDDQLIKIARKIDPGVRTSAPYAASFEKNDKGPAATGSLDLTLPSAAHAQRFAAAAMKLGTKVQYEGSRVRCSYDHKHGPALMSLASQAHRGQAAVAATPPPINPSKQFVYRFPDHASLEQFLQAAKQLSGLRAISKSATTARMEGDATKLWRLAEQFDGVRA